MSSNAQDEVITVGYWSIRGLAAPLRMMVMFAKRPLYSQNYECAESSTGEGFEHSSWLSQKDSLKAENALVNLPYIRIGEKGKLITQSTACFLALGRALNMLGETEEDLSDVEQLLCEAMDLRNAIVRVSYSGEVSHLPNFLESTMNASANTSYSKLNLWIMRKYSCDELANSENKIFFVGNHATAADFHIWELLDQLFLMTKFSMRHNDSSHRHDTSLIFDNAPGLKAFYASFKALPENEAYFKSSLYTSMPVNNKMAKSFGATLSGEAWDFVNSKNDMPWLNKSGLY